MVNILIPGTVGSHFRMCGSRFTTALFLILFIIIVIGMFICGFWPFNFLPANNISCNEKTGSMLFDDPSISFVSLKKSNAEINFPFSGEMLIHPNEKSTNYIAEILYLSKGKEEVISLGQWNSGLLLRYIDDNKKKSSLYIKGAIDTSKTIKVSFVIDSDYMELSSDGFEPRKCKLTSLIKPRQSDFLVFGNSVTGTGQWFGEVFSVSFSKSTFKKIKTDDSGPHPNSIIETSSNLISNFYNLERVANNWNIVDSMDKFSLPLTIPKKFSPPIRKYLTPFWEDMKFEKNYISDVIVNFFCFIPSGLFLAGALRNRYSRKKILLIATICGLLISFTIETAQVFLPSRTSQLSDLITNTLGALTGAAMFDYRSAKKMNDQKT
jgi:VanZ family protein